MRHAPIPTRQGASVEASVLRGVLALHRDRQRAAPLIESLLERNRSWGDLTKAEKQLIEGVPLVDCALQQSFAVRYRDPKAMLRLAEKARLLVDGINARRYGPKVLADLKARVYADLANAYRVTDDLLEAEATFEVAAAWARKGTSDVRLAAHIADLASSLRKDQRCFAEAHELLDFALSTYWTLGEVHRVGRVLIKKGIIRGNENEPEEAIVFLARGLQLIQPEKDHKLERLVMHALTLNLVGARLYSEARTLLENNRRFFRRDKSRLNQLRFHWLEGKIAFGLEEHGKAEAGLQIARLGFRRAEQLYDSALVSLDLALLYAKQGRRLEIRRLAGEMVETFRAYRIAREAIASLLLLQKSSGQPGVSMDQLRGQIQTLSLLLAELERKPVRAKA